MSFHSFFEAMALGIASDVKSALLMATSIGLHQPAESMALLVAFLKTSMPNRNIIKCLGLFSMVAPVGVLTGVFISRVASPWLEAAIVAITAGTFLYVGATEVVNEEFEDSKGLDKWMKFTSFLGGVVSIFMITQLSEKIGGHSHGGHSHSHSHGFDGDGIAAGITSSFSSFFGGGGSKSGGAGNVQTSADGSKLGAIPSM